MPDNNDAAAVPTPTLPTVAADVPISDTPMPSAGRASVPEMNIPNIPESSVPVADVPTGGPDSVEANPTDAPKAAVGDDMLAEVAHKISDSKNVLVALSSDPSVDEMAAAIGLSLYLDKLGKRATAIYSGNTPNALEFLKPGETFEPSVDTLQDFVIALNQEKADHLRYKLDGDYVKIYITPYKSKIEEEDLEFSYGDYNVDLVLALDVANGVDLDSALREHGRIMHDAVIINITTGNPGKLGEIEWSDKSASSVSEMIANLLYKANSKVKIGKEEATAFLTGIVAATNRFSNAVTTPGTMNIASKLMESGANQQLVSKNITPDIENEMVNMGGLGSLDESGVNEKTNDPTKLDIKHEKGKKSETDSENVKSEDEPETKNEEPEKELDDNKESINSEKTEEIAGLDEANDGVEPSNLGESENLAETDKVDETGKNDESDGSSLLDELKEAEAGLMTAGAETVPEEKAEPLEVSSAKVETPQDMAKEMTDAVEAGVDINATPAAEPAPTIEPTESTPVATTTVAPIDDGLTDKSEKVIQPTGDLGDLAAASDNETNKYGQMLEAALESVGSDSAPAPVISTPAVEENPAVAGAPEVPANPEINGVPEINYMPMPGDTVLPPPPTPPINMDEPIAPTESMATTEPMTTAEPTVGTEPSIPATPVMPEVAPGVSELANNEAPVQPQNPVQTNDPSAFKIPGM